MSRCVRAKRRDWGQDIRVPLGSTRVPRPASGEGGRGKEGVTGTFWLLPFSPTLSAYNTQCGQVPRSGVVHSEPCRKPAAERARGATPCGPDRAARAGTRIGSAARGRGAGQRPRHHGAQSTSEAGDAPAAVGCALRTKTALRKEATPLCATGSPLLAHGRAPRRARGSSPRVSRAGGAAAPSAAGGAGSAARPAVLTCVFADEVVRHGKLALI